MCNLRLHGIISWFPLDFECIICGQRCGIATGCKLRESFMDASFWGFEGYVRFRGGVGFT